MFDDQRMALAFVTLNLKNNLTINYKSFLFMLMLIIKECSLYKNALRFLPHSCNDESDNEPFGGLNNELC